MPSPRISVWIALSLAACGGGDDFEPTPPVPPSVGAPQVGAAEGELRLPIGTPLSGYSVRCSCLGGGGRQDSRDSAYTTDFVPSTGVQVWPSIKVVWISNGDEDLVVTKTDSIYSFDGLVEGLEDSLSKATGKDLHGKVVHTANHSHSSWGSFNHGVTWYLGSDRYNEEIFQRMVEEITTVAMEAHGTLQPAKIGAKWVTDWDPTDAVYHDRRGSNNELQPWGPDGPPLGKDPHLGILRFDTLDDQPIAMVVNFGMHGIIEGEQNTLASSEAGGHVELALEETFDRPVVVMFTQGSGGDASPGGRQDGFAKMESVGQLAADLIRPHYDSMVTSDKRVSMETVTRTYTKHPSTIRVTRNGTTNLRYAPFDKAVDFEADNVVYEEDGVTIASPIDEFNTEFGGVFCGSGDLDLPIGNFVGVSVFPYDQCLKVELIADLLQVFFELEEEQVVLPLPETLRAQTTLARLGPVLTQKEQDGTLVAVEQPLVVGFFPGEPVYSYGEQWRRRVKDELGFEDAMMVGYSQDHEGYLLIPEDWLTGDYEPDIGVWGPLEAEYVMERVLEESGPLVRTQEREPVDPYGQYKRTVYEKVPLPTIQPDYAPDAGTRFTDAPEYFWTPFVDIGNDEAPQRPSEEELTVPDEVPRVQGIVQLAWVGGDPMVDSPTVTLQRKGDDGEFAPVLKGSGRPVTDGSILLAHTPEPLYPVESNQTHRWWAGWQAVGPWADRETLPLGTYRLHVEGMTKASDTETWPWATEPYTVDSPEFDLVPGALDVQLEIDEALDLEGLTIAFPAPPNGWRLVDQDGNFQGDNPVRGDLSVFVAPAWDPLVDDLDADGVADPDEYVFPDEPTQIVVESQLVPDGNRTYVSYRLPTTWGAIRVEDAAGNHGLLAYVPPYVPPPPVP